MRVKPLSDYVATGYEKCLEATAYDLFSRTSVRELPLVESFEF